MKLEKWDLVKVIGYNEKEIEKEYIEKFIGAKGIIVAIDSEYDYQCDVVFFDMDLQKQSMDNGGVLWRYGDLEKLEGVE